VIARRAFLGALPLGMSMIPALAFAQAPRVPRVGYLWGGPESSEPESVNGLRQGLKELSYVEGRTIVVEYRYGDGRPERFAGLVAELVALKVDVLLVAGSLMSQVAKSGTSTIPIVCTTPDPIQLGLVQSLARPGGNVTGLTLMPGDEFVGKMLELLKEAAPKVSRVAFLYDPANPVQLIYLRGLEKVAPRLGIRLGTVEIRQPEDLDRVFARVKKQSCDAFITHSDPLLVTNRTRVTALAVRHHLLAVYGIRSFVEAGGLMSYGPSIFDLWRRVARYMDKILKGAKPADLPVEEPTKFEFVINLKTAKALGLMISQSLLLRADDVIQ
jgi:putative ABC transport system substrate-binding protein